LLDSVQVESMLSQSQALAKKGAQEESDDEDWD
jgi:hypothetical protein